jgi:hypothetical protein
VEDLMLRSACNIVVGKCQRKREITLKSKAQMSGGLIKRDLDE